MVYEVVHCAECGKPIKSVPSWLAGVDVKFSCESCRQKHPRPFLGADNNAAPVRGGRRSSDENEEEGGGIAVVAPDEGDEDTSIEDLPEDFPEDEPAAEESIAE